MAHLIAASEWRLHQARHEHETIDRDRDGEGQISEAVAVLEGIDGYHKAVGLIVAIEFHQVDLGAQSVGLVRRQAAVGQAFARKAKQLVG